MAHGFCSATLGEKRLEQKILTGDNAKVLSMHTYSSVQKEKEAASRSNPPSKSERRTETRLFFFQDKAIIWIWRVLLHRRTIWCSDKTFKTFAVVKTLEIESKDQKNLQSAAHCSATCMHLLQAY